MPYCPSCRYEYIIGINRCPDCDVELIPELPPEKEAVTNERFVPVFVARDHAEGHIIKGILLSAGIPVLEQAHVGDMYITELAVPAAGLRQVTLTVPESMLHDAQKIIMDAMNSGELMPEDT